MSKSIHSQLVGYKTTFVESVVCIDFAFILYENGFSHFFASFIGK